MSRLSRFEAYRYLGVRDTMRFYDCDDDQQFDELTVRVSGEGLIGKDLIQAFAPDTPTEAMNRGFRPAAVSDPA
ncbi:MAG TPA: hypothetical protein VHM29_11815 [Acidimicrobiia bacterium]|jgi:hypothetical protein|nr:hypothetical protein [Acidimicrobiia bacterium]